jgi:hypothetical protein
MTIGAAREVAKAGDKVEAAPFYLEKFQSKHDLASPPEPNREYFWPTGGKSGQVPRGYCQTR